MLAFLRSLFGAYVWVEPTAFRQAEQFGLEDAPCHAPAVRELAQA